MQVYVSGLFSGPNPSPGLGVARSLRLAFPGVELIGVDYSLGSTGLHWAELDRVEPQPSWKEIDLDEYAARIRLWLGAGGFWISGLDLEALWLSEALAGEANLLVPDARAFAAIRKPPLRIAAELGVRVPPSISGTRDDPEIHAFCARHGWRVWVKGPYYEAKKARTWRELLRIRDAMTETWSTGDLHVQAHVSGSEESIAFAAHEGHLVGACWLVKRAVTSEGKTWAGEVLDLPGAWVRKIHGLVEELDWSGGGELEFVRAEDGRLFLIEVNPRFPAWIHGATLTGRNLPAALLEHATGGTPIPARGSAQAFVRVVLEVPARNELALPPPPRTTQKSEEIDVLEGKHPSGMPVLARRLHPDFAPSPQVPSWQPPDTLARDLEAAIVDPTPNRVFLPRTARALWERAARVARAVSVADLSATIAYSVKTNPDRRLLALARTLGFFAETISQAEVDVALSNGFLGTEVVLNGPAKWWPQWPSRGFPLGAAFADSADEVDRMASLLGAGKELALVVGVRVRPGTVESRFGVDVRDRSTWRSMCRLAASLPDTTALGVHFHVPSSTVGSERWRAYLAEVLDAATQLQSETGRPVECFDLGGGWHTDDWNLFTRSLFDIAAALHTALPGLSRVLLEPGKALAQPSMALLTRVLDIRKGEEGQRDVVADASIAELPEARSFPHRVLAVDPYADCVPLGRGPDRILGRLCMESDILARQIALPPSLSVGQLLAIWDAGAYDASMSFRFGQG